MSSRLIQAIEKKKPFLKDSKNFKDKKKKNTLANTMKHVFRLMSCMQCHFRECNNMPLVENEDRD